MLEKFLLLKITYQGKIKRPITNSLYNPPKPDKGIPISLLFINYPLAFLLGIYILKILFYLYHFFFINFEWTKIGFQLDIKK